MASSRVRSRARPKVGANRVFLASLKASNGTVLRARQAGETSLGWKVRSKGPLSGAPVLSNPAHRKVQ